jgi:hypothetical protein
MTPQIFVSYASLDRARVNDIIRPIADAGGRFWWDQKNILGGENYGPLIVEGIRASKILLLCCTAAALRSRNVKQEIQLAWKYSVPYLPLLVERVSFDEQLQYWLEGWQWVEVLDWPVEYWLPKVLAALAARGVELTRPPSSSEASKISQSRARTDIDELFALARFTDQIWPVKADPTTIGPVRALRDLGAPQDDVLHQFPIGSHLRIQLEVHADANLVLLDRGPSGTLYCLCPSAFAPQQRFARGRHLLPQVGGRLPTFVVSGKPGREHLLAILSEELLPFDWMPKDPRTPAHVLSANDVAALTTTLRELPANSWCALSTYFDTIAG